MFRNSFIHEILAEFLQPFWQVGKEGVSPCQFVVTFQLGLGISTWFCNGFSLAGLPSLLLRGDAGLGIEPSKSCVDDVRVVRVDCRQTRDHERHVILRVALYPSTIFNEMWFSISGPLV